MKKQLLLLALVAAPMAYAGDMTDAGGNAVDIVIVTPGAAALEALAEAAPMAAAVVEASPAVAEAVAAAPAVGEAVTTMVAKGRWEGTKEGAYAMANQLGTMVVNNPGRTGAAAVGIIASVLLLRYILKARGTAAVKKDIATSPNLTAGEKATAAAITTNPAVATAVAATSEAVAQAAAPVVTAIADVPAAVNPGSRSPAQVQQVEQQIHAQVAQTKPSQMTPAERRKLLNASRRS